MSSLDGGQTWSLSHRVRRTCSQRSQAVSRRTSPCVGGVVSMEPTDVQLSLLRALTPDTPVILCPAMNTHMYQHKFTAKHLRVVQEELDYMVLGPQGTGTLACGDEGGSTSGLDH